MASTRWYLVSGAVAAAVWLGLLFDPVLARVTDIDAAVLRALLELRSDLLTAVFQELTGLGSTWAVRTVGWATIGVLVLFRRFYHLAAYLVILALGALLASTLSTTIGRMRPTGVEILGSWQGYAHPARPVAAASLVLVGALGTLVPEGIWRNRGKWIAATWLSLLCLAQLYLGVAHPTDVLAGLVCGWALPIVAFRLLVPEEAFPISYRGGRRAHLDVGGRRGEAIVNALDQQLGLDVVSVEPFGLGGSAGSTPLRLRVRGALGTGPEEAVLFAKLYAKNHLRSDRWYKLVRTVLYGRLEDEKPFSTVRRLVEYEDHLLRLLRDAGLPAPRPYGFVEITPEREYVIVMEFFEGAEEIGAQELDDAAIDSGLHVVRQLWQAGVAHRDIKPSNLLVRDSHCLLIDVAFATVRPTPWRQAVDLANMMLTLALSSSAERVYARALEQFAPVDIAEAFAATRSVTIPTQLRDRLRADPRNLPERFRSLAPQRPPVPIQVWSVRRVALTVGLLAAAVLGVVLLVAYAQVAELL
ncbi:MAG TPA: phosphatase PAP2 family protein [Acidimicrobiales bacterium]